MKFYIVYAALGATVASSLFLYSATRSTPRPPMVLSQGPEESSFDESWRDGATKLALSRSIHDQEPEALVKQDRLPLSAPTPHPLPYPTLDRPELPSIITRGVEEPRHRRHSRRQGHRSHGDICTRHGLQKVHYGRTWRCKKSR